jgi:hypothetical protein
MALHPLKRHRLRVLPWCIDHPDTEYVDDDDDDVEEESSEEVRLVRR